MRRAGWSSSKHTGKTAWAAVDVSVTASLWWSELEVVSGEAGVMSSLFLGRGT